MNIKSEFILKSMRMANVCTPRLARFALYSSLAWLKTFSDGADVAVMPKGPFPLRAWKKAFFVSFIDLRLKRAVKIEASAKKNQ